ncbi:MAG: 3-dehydroquinate synthase [Pseudonocardiaceae bacterium]
MSAVGLHTVLDKFPLPDGRAVIEGRSARRDLYPVTIVDDLPSAVNAVCGMLTHASIALVTDDGVGAIYAEQTEQLFRERNVSVVVKSIPPGEGSKTVPMALELMDWLAQSLLSRRDVVVSLGGGVVIDTAGWVASAYMRGIPYINMPTTLLADVDAALGGKVAVDHPTAKNLIGAFYQPLGVVTNVGFLATLDDRHLRAGLSEAVKKGIIASPALFEFIETRLDDILGKSPTVLRELVRASSAIKCRLIERDPYEEDLRRPLNFGHTVGHALETTTGYGPVLHGEAVSFGMSVAARIAQARGLVDARTSGRIQELLRRADLPTHLSDLAVTVDVELLVESMVKVRLIRDGHLRFVLPLALGETAIVDGVTDSEIREAVST